MYVPVFNQCRSFTQCMDIYLLRRTIDILDQLGVSGHCPSRAGWAPELSKSTAAPPRSSWSAEHCIAAVGAAHCRPIFQHSTPLKRNNGLTTWSLAFGGRTMASGLLPRRQGRPSWTLRVASKRMVACAGSFVLGCLFA